MQLRRTVVAAGLAVAIASAAAGAASPGWQQLGAPEAGIVQTLERGLDGTVYAGTPAGLFTSADARVWRRAGGFPGAPDEADVTVVDAPFGSTAYAVVSGDLFKTADAGTSWQARRTGIDPKEVVVSVAAAPANPDVAYAGTWVAGERRTGRVYRSTDGGATWARTAYGLEEGAEPIVMLVDPTTAETVYVGTANPRQGEGNSGGVYKTDDAGATWTPLSIGLPLDTSVVSLALDPSDRSMVYAGTDDHGVFKSADGGLRWLRARAGLETEEGYSAVYDLVVSPAQPNVVYAATEHGFATSANGGKTWQAQGGSDVPELSALVLAPENRDAFLAGSVGQGVLRTVDGGAQWVAANTGLTAVRATTIAVDPAAPDVAYIGTAEAGLFATTDGGRVWSAVAGAVARTVPALVVAPDAAHTIYAGTSGGWGYSGSGVLKSVDGGRSWTSANHGLAEDGDVDALAVDQRRPATVYAAVNGEVFKTTSAGAAWRRTTRGMTVYVDAIATDPIRPGRVFVSGWRSNDGGAAAAFSNDAGKTWKLLGRGLPREDGGVRALVVTSPSGDVFAAVDQGSGAGDAGYGVYRLRRGGKHWTGIAAGLPRRPDGGLELLRSLAARPKTGTVYVGTNRGLYVLIRGTTGLRWKLADPVFAGRTVRRIAFAADGSRLYAATPGSVFRQG